MTQQQNGARRSAVSTAEKQSSADAAWWRFWLRTRTFAARLVSAEAQDRETEHRPLTVRVPSTRARLRAGR
jgi:hypothetical protein